MLDGVDLGCGIGGSIEWAMHRFGGNRYLGFDSDAFDVKEARWHGFNAELADITHNKFIIPECRFITSLHTLEHLKDEDAIFKLLQKCVNSAKEFVFIKVPFFDEMDYLESLGVRLTWTNWITHTTAVTSAMLIRLLQRLQVGGVVGFLDPVENTLSKEIIPFDSPVDTLYYPDELRDSKISMPLVNIYRETYCYININNTQEKWDELMEIDIL